MAHILLLTPQLPYPPQQGTSLRNYHILLALAQMHDVTLLTFVEPDQSMDDEVIAPLTNLCVQLETVPVPQRSTLKRLTQLVTTQQPDMGLRLATPLFSLKVRELLSKRPYPFIQIEGIELAPYIPLIREVSPRSKIIFDNHNAETELQRRNFLTDRTRPKRWPAAIYSWIQVQRLRRFERWVCQEADGVTAVSELDAALLKQLAGNTKTPIVPIPNSIDVQQYRLTLDDEAVPFDILFAGKMDYRPNVDGVLWFAEAVWPLILAQRPSTTWAIVGQKPHERLHGLSALPGVTVTGWVPSIRPYWHGAKVTIMPFRVGSGTRLKAIEAMASGTPIVSTTIGIEGFPIIPGETVLVADEAEEMATAVLSLLDDPAKRESLHQAGLTFVQQYDWRQVNGAFTQLYDQLGEQKQRK